MSTIELNEFTKYLPLNTQEQTKIVGKSNSTNESSSSSSRWNTKEFHFYYLVMATVIPYMFYVTYGLSKTNHPNYHLYSNLLSNGWIFNRKIDNSDLQYAQFRNHLPLLLALAFIYFVTSRLYDRLIQSTYAKNCDSRVKRKTTFNLIVSLIVITSLHGTGLIKVLVIITTSYILGRIGRGSKWNPFLTWTFNLWVLFMNERYNGYTFESLFGLAWMDHYQGLLPRWHILFNFTMLRLVSYNMDYYWRHHTQQSHQYHSKEDVEPSERERIQQSCAPYDYNYLYFLTYVLYLPLYICGPIITFNDFISQLRIPSSKITTAYVLKYALRLAAVILLMEFTLHHLYVVAISKAQAWDGDLNTPLELSMIGYFNLVIIWMKLLIPWRFFRLWALGDRIYTEENMIRCVSNNFSGQRFWKSWHRSFHRWTIRYIYLPLGGSGYVALNIWVVFTFVAIWHDIQLNLLAWGWLICLFMLPEIIGTRLFTYKKFGGTFYYRFVCGLGAVCNILMMMVANLVGFCLGLDGTKAMVNQIFGSTQGFLFLIGVVSCLYVAAQVMFEIRESERRRGDPKWLM
ncbi:MAG: MBOAT, membrane-bound O-acyltransferase family-domain-containing protein [Benjaminiella poitrasii]|nr:MAG: MBOAT, membrane-bound O-acyltransferase family-domain-containing protein [Benjaminiella poitrasii]